MLWIQLHKMSNVGKNISELSKGRVIFVEEFLGKQLKAAMKLEASVTVNGMVQASSIMDNLSTFLCSLVTKIEWDGKEIELTSESIEKWTEKYQQRLRKAGYIRS